jgi:hypothetical protein
MTAMGCERFVVTLVDAKQGKREERHWRETDVIKSMAWLKRMNARGYDVLIRPDEEHGLVLLGDLNKAGLQTLRERGFAPTVSVEIARDLYQAWVKLAPRALTEPLRGQAADGLLRGLGRSSAGVVSHADGRLAGFTNQQALRQGGQHPYVLVEDSDGKVASAGRAYLARFEFEQSKSKELERTHQRSRSRGPTR